VSVTSPSRISFLVGRAPDGGGFSVTPGNLSREQRILIAQDNADAGMDFDYEIDRIYIDQIACEGT